MKRALRALVAVTLVAACSSRSGNSTGEESSGTTGGQASSPNVDTTPIPTPHCTVGVTNANINISVTTKTGPKGATAPVPITNALYSMGIDDRTPSDFVPSPDPTFTAFLKAIKPGMLRFPAGVNGQHYTWSSSGAGGYPTMTPTFVDQFIALCRASGAAPFMAVNIETASTADAISLLTYANVTKKYGVQWWQIGNEPNLPGEWAPSTPGGSDCTSQVTTCESPTGYPAKYLQFRSAMLAVDPTIKFVGLESYTGEGILGQHSEIDWFTPFLAGVGSNVDAVAWHYYPLYSGTGTLNSGKSSSATISNLLQESASDWPPAGMSFVDTILPYMKSAMAKTAPKAQVWIDEFAEDSGTMLNATGTGDVMAGALWASDILGRYADQGTGAIFHFIFKANQPDSGFNYGYTLLDPNNAPRPEYYTFWLMANHFGNKMVATTTDQIAKVASHAALDSNDGSLHVMLTNKTEQAQTVRVQLPDYKPVRASMYTITGDSLAGKNVALNGQQLTMANIGQGGAAIPSTAGEACIDNTITVPPVSVTMLIFTVK